MAYKGVEFFMCNGDSVTSDLKKYHLLCKSYQFEPFSIHLDCSKILSHVQPAVSKFLTNLQIYKTTVNAKQGLEFYTSYTSVSEDWLSLRDIVLVKKTPTKVNNSISLFYFKISQVKDIILKKNFS